MPTTVPVETLILTTREVRWFAFDFSKAPEVVAGETLSAPVMHGGTGLTLGAPAVLATAFDGIPSGQGVRVLVSDADDDTTYDLSCTVTTQGGATLEAPGRLAGVGVA